MIRGRRISLLTMFAWCLSGSLARAANAPGGGLALFPEPLALPAQVTVEHQTAAAPDGVGVDLVTVYHNAGDQPVELNDQPLCDLYWTVAEPADDASYDKLSYRADEWFGSAYYTGASWTRVGRDWQHPGDPTPSVRCFRAPRAGQVVVTGRVFKLDPKGDGIRATIRHGLEAVWSAELEGNDAKGVEPRVELTVQAGDRLRFVVDKRGAITCDTTGWDPVVRYVDGPRYQASEGFSVDCGPSSPWVYEAEQTNPEAAAQAALTTWSGNQQWYASAYWSGPDWTRVGKNWQHPGEATASVRCFTAPRGGQVTVSGRVKKLHLAGDGIRAAIALGRRELWSVELGGQDGDGREPSLTTAVKQGDVLRFIIDKRGGISCDTTGWDPTVTYADGERFVASESFGDQQGTNGWSYALQRSTRSLPPPRVRSVGTELAWREWPLTSGQLDLAAGDTCGPVLLTDCAGESSLLVGLPGGQPVVLRRESDTLVRLRAPFAQPLRLAPGQTIELPPVRLARFDGLWTSALPSFAQQLGATEAAQRAYQALAAGGRVPELELLLWASSEWRHDDRLNETAGSYAVACADQLARTKALLARLRVGQKPTFLAAEQAALAKLEPSLPAADAKLDTWRAAWLKLHLLKRRIALSNPLLGDAPLLFCKRRPPNYSHLVMQYFGWRQQTGGGLYVLDQPGWSTRVKALTGDSLPPGNYLEPRLSYDARRVVFSYVDTRHNDAPPSSYAVNESGPDEAYFHLYELRLADGQVRQVTSGVYDDTMPEYLPNGDIVFCSTRRQGYSRCFGAQFSQRWHSYTLHRVHPDGSGLNCLSYNDVSEWFPAIDNAGRVLFARWDYIDRDAVTHQNLWAMRPDGTNTSAVWGNAAPKPHCTFQVHAIPGSDQLAFIASAHHSVTGGPLCLLDPRVDANSLEAVTRLTPGPFPEAESRSIPEYYDAPWPLSETDFLIAGSVVPLRWEGQPPQPDQALGLYLLDADGNRELLYRDPTIGCTTPIPLRPRPAPPVLPDLSVPDSELAELLVSDIYQGLDGVARGAVKQLRVVQIFPKTTFVANQPLIGFAREENARAILGTVPVEPDGSARFLVPARKPVLLQALDADGCAVRTMRSLMHLQPGERTSCVGCHERPLSAGPNTVVQAMQREPSRLDPGEFGGRPFSYVEVVQPVLDQHCVSCHTGDAAKAGLDLTRAADRGFTKSYWSLCGDPEAFSGAKTCPSVAAAALVPRFGMRNRIEMSPVGGTYGALGSRLLKLLRVGHQGVQLSPSELRRLAVWIDLNAIFYGAYDPEAQARQLAGERLPMPEVQ